MKLSDFSSLHFSRLTLDSIVVCKDSAHPWGTRHPSKDKHLIEWARITLWRYCSFSMGYTKETAMMSLGKTLEFDMGKVR